MNAALPDPLVTGDRHVIASARALAQNSPEQPAQGKRQGLPAKAQDWDLKVCGRMPSAGGPKVSAYLRVFKLKKGKKSFSLKLKKGLKVCAYLQAPCRRYARACLHAPPAPLTPGRKARSPSTPGGNLQKNGSARKQDHKIRQKMWARSKFHQKVISHSQSNAKSRK